MFPREPADATDTADILSRVPDVQAVMVFMPDRIDAECWTSAHG